MRLILCLMYLQVCRCADYTRTLRIQLPAIHNADCKYQIESLHELRCIVSALCAIE